MSSHIVASTYVDHQANVNYPIELVIESCQFADEHWLFGSDVENTEYMAKLAAKDPSRLHVACLEHKIKDGNDISKSMNLQLARLRPRADYILLAQADTLATSAEIDLIAGFCRLDHIKSALHFATLDAHCYIEFWPGYGHTLVGADWPGSFVGDGTWTADLKQESEPVCMHVGYLTPEACARHLRQHGMTYGEPPQSQGNHERRAKLWEEDPDEFVRDRARWIHAYWRQAPWSSYPVTMCGDFRPGYLSVIEKMGKREEYEHVRTVVREMYREIPWAPAIPQ